MVFQSTFSPKNRSASEDAVTVTMSPLGLTSSYATTVSMVNPNWFVFHEYPKESGVSIIYKARRFEG
jgi:hypothetical protein